MDVKSVLSKLTCAGRKAFVLDHEMHKLGYDNTPYNDLYGRIADVIYMILGEQCDFHESVTALYMQDRGTTDAQCADGLFAAYQQRNGEPQLSDATMGTLRYEAKQKGIPVQNMISLILAEWAMRRECVREFTKAV